jgi:hypothetical protein
MKFIQKGFVVSAGLALLLAACGTTEEVAEQTNGGAAEQTETKPSETEEKKAAETAGNGEESQETAETGDGAGQPEAERAPEQALTYEEKGQAVEKTGYLKTSDNQNYSMYVLDGYTLEEEEPGKDLIMLTADDQSFMRIEIVPADMDVATVEDIVKTTAEAISPEAALHEDFKKEGMLKDAVWYKAVTSEDVVHLILIKGEQPIKLSIYTPKDQENIEPFLAMAATIQAKQS